MATKEVTVCDVFGTTKDVVSCEIEIRNMSNPNVAPRKWTVDLSPRARERLIKFIGRAATPPKRKNLPEAASDD